MEILTPVRMQIGAGFVGDLDEVRISNVARSADWVRLQYENQKPLQTLVGPLVPAGHHASRFRRKQVTLDWKARAPRHGPGRRRTEGLLDHPPSRTERPSPRSTGSISRSMPAA